jgi:hypothetical protein
LQFSTEEESKRILIFKENTGKLSNDLKRFVEGESMEFPNFYQMNALHFTKEERYNATQSSFKSLFKSSKLSHNIKSNQE